MPLFNSLFNRFVSLSFSVSFISFRARARACNILEHVKIWLFFASEYAEQLCVQSCFRCCSRTVVCVCLLLFFFGGVIKMFCQPYHNVANCLILRWSRWMAFECASTAFRFRFMIYFFVWFYRWCEIHIVNRGRQRTMWFIWLLSLLSCQTLFAAHSVHQQQSVNFGFLLVIKTWEINDSFM